MESRRTVQTSAEAWLPRAFFSTAAARVAGIIGVFLLAAFHAEAALSIAKIFDDHMVLQRQMPVPVWGTAAPGSEVSVEFAGQTTRGVTGEDGRWRVVLEPLEAEAAGRELTVSTEGERLTIKDVLVGEVWFAGGQSNIQYTAGAMAKHLAIGKELASTADLPEVRFFRINEAAATVPRQDLSTARWTVCTPVSVAGHSAVGFVFARRLNMELSVPVGLIDSSVGGTPIEPYIPEASFVGHPTLEKLAAFAKAGDKQAIIEMSGGTFIRADHWLASRLYNGRIAPVVPYAIRGAVWYQGESNCGQGEDPRDYGVKLRALVTGWRRSWGRADLPVLVVQLPQWKSYAWPFLREEQRRAVAELDHAGLVVTIDLDHANDIHPPNKIDVGERLARWPLVWFHDRKLPVQGPVFRSAEARGDCMEVFFDDAEDGLMAGRVGEPGQATVDSGSRAVNGCELCDPQGVWVEAEGTIVGKSLVVKSPAVPRPVAVRYACLPQAPGKGVWNLFGRSGLPAGPFCSDSSRMPYLPEKNSR